MRRLPLGFSLHVPVQLACLWLTTAVSSLAWTLGSHPTAFSLGTALAAQLVVGFLLPTLGCFVLEARQRRAFVLALQARRAAKRARAQALRKEASVGPG